MLDGHLFRTAAQQAQNLLRRAALLDSEASRCSSVIVGARKRAEANDLRARARRLQTDRSTRVRTS